MIIASVCTHPGRSCSCQEEAMPVEPDIEPAKQIKSSDEAAHTLCIFSDMVDVVAVLDGTLDLNRLVGQVGHPGAGAIATFLGVTRDNFDGKQVTRLEYEGYVPMAEKVMREICTQIRSRWDVISVGMEHRLGVCPVGEASVIIAVSSPHRREALEATHYAIDALKATVPIWKKEFYEGGGSLDESACPQWKKNKEWQGGLDDLTPSSSSTSSQQSNT